MGGSASCRSVTSRSSDSLVLSDAKMPDSLPQQKPSSTSYIDHVHDDRHRTRDQDGENQAHGAPAPAPDEQGYGHHERGELEALTDCHSGPYERNILAIQVPECTHGRVRDAHCSLWQ